MKDNLLPAEARTRVTQDLRITGVILAGRQGRRMGTIDKGLGSIDGRPMVAHVIGRLRPQVDEILINANQHRVEYEAFGYPVLADAIGGFAGPLAGLQVALAHASFARVATVPCDSPFLPADLIARLSAALEASEAELAVARTFDQPHPVFALVRKTVLPHLTQFLEGGGRKIDAWYATLKTVEVAFDDEAEAFRNINTTDELSQASRR